MLFYFMPQIIDANYRKVHKYLAKNYGKASKCEMVNCPKLRDKYHYALKKGFEYEFKIENFIQLCVTCHKRYDMNDQTRENIRIGKIYIRKAIIQLSMNDEFIKEHASICDAYKEVNINKGNLMATLKGNRASCGGYKWIYKK